MRHIQRTLFAKAVFDFELPPLDAHRVIVARIAEPFGATTVEEGDRAAIHALPVDVFGAMTSLANVGANAKLSDEAGPTD